MGVITRPSNNKSTGTGEADRADEAVVTPPPVVTDALSVGQILENKYRIERIVDEDGIAITLTAKHLKLDDLVTIKVLSRQARALPDVRARFAREAKTHARIRSEHAVHILDAGILPHIGPYMVTEYLDGRDLADLLKKEGPLSAVKATELILQACDAVAVAHASGVVHGDLQPSNLFVARRGNQQVLKVLGFRVAKLGEGGGPAQGSRASFEYLSPEQVREGATVDHRSDIWALGMVLYEMLTGRSGFAIDAFQEFEVGRSSGGPPRVRLLPGAPTGMGRAIARCLARDAAARFQNIAELATALGPFAPGPRTELYVERCTFTLRDAAFAVAVAGELTAKEPGALAVSRSSAEAQTKIEVDPRLTAEAIARRAPNRLPPPSLAETAIAEAMQTQPEIKIPPEVDFDLRPRRAGLKFFGGAALSFLAVLGVRWVVQRLADAPKGEVATPATPLPRVAEPPAAEGSPAASPSDPLPSTEEHGLSTAPEPELARQAQRPADDGNVHERRPVGPVNPPRLPNLAVAPARLNQRGPAPATNVPVPARPRAVALAPRPVHVPLRAPAVGSATPAMRVGPHTGPATLRRAAYIEPSRGRPDHDDADTMPATMEPGPN